MVSKMTSTWTRNYLPKLLASSIGPYRVVLNGRRPVWSSPEPSRRLRASIERKATRWPRSLVIGAALNSEAGCPREICLLHIPNGRRNRTRNIHSIAGRSASVFRRPKVYYRRSLARKGPVDGRETNSRERRQNISSARQASHKSSACNFVLSRGGRRQTPFLVS